MTSLCISVSDSPAGSSPAESHIWTPILQVCPPSRSLVSCLCLPPHLNVLAVICISQAFVWFSPFCSLCLSQTFSLLLPLPLSTSLFLPFLFSLSPFLPLSLCMCVSLPFKIRLPFCANVCLSPRPLDSISSVSLLALFLNHLGKHVCTWYALRFLGCEKVW